MLLLQDTFLSLWKFGVINAQTRDIQDVRDGPSDGAQHELPADSALPLHEPGLCSGCRPGLNQGSGLGQLGSLREQVCSLSCSEQEAMEPQANGVKWPCTQDRNGEIFRIKTTI